MPDAGNRAADGTVSVVTPTFRRPGEVRELLLNLAEQAHLPFELILVDCAPDEERETEMLVRETAPSLPFPCRYLRSERGTALQRNRGIDEARGAFIAFIDDDIRLEPDFFQAMLGAFARDAERKVGGIVGYRTNEHFKADRGGRWKWYRRLGLLTTYEPGRYDFQSGYPINANMQPPFSGVRKVDFMTTSCAVWRREVLDSGHRFDLFFADYGMLEDAHFALRAGQQWELWQCGDARCRHLHSMGGRVDGRKIGYKCVVNYYYVFRDIVRPLTWRHKLRFWRYQLVELFRLAASALRRRRRSDVMEVLGRVEGFLAAMRGLPRQS